MAGPTQAGRFRGSPRATDAPLSPDVTLTLTGQTATFTPGVMAPNVSYGLTAQTGIFTEGTLSLSLAYALTAQTATFTEGVIARAVDYSLAGQTATFTEGTLTATLGGDVTLSLTGQTATFSEGSLSASLAYALSGQSATFSEGTIAQALSYALAGQTATFTEGIITAEAGGDVTIQLSGLQAMFSLGRLSITGADVADFSGGFLYAYELEQSRRRKRRHEQQGLEEDARTLKDETDSEIALLLRKQEAEDERRAELARLQRMVRDHSSTALELSDRAKIAYLRALTQANFSAMEALDRELLRQLEEEEITALMFLLNED